MPILKQTNKLDLFQIVYGVDHQRRNRDKLYHISLSPGNPVALVKIATEFLTLYLLYHRRGEHIGRKYYNYVLIESNGMES